MDLGQALQWIAQNNVRLELHPDEDSVIGGVDIRGVQIPIRCINTPQELKRSFESITCMVNGQ